MRSLRLLLTFVRTIEIRKAEWTEVDLALALVDPGRGRRGPGRRRPGRPAAPEASAREVVQREPVRSADPCDTVAAGLQPTGGHCHYIQSDETSTALTLYRLRCSV